MPLCLLSVLWIPKRIKRQPVLWRHYSLHTRSTDFLWLVVWQFRLISTEHRSITQMPEMKWNEIWSNHLSRCANYSFLSLQAFLVTSWCYQTTTTFILIENQTHLEENYIAFCWLCLRQDMSFIYQPTCIFI